MHSPKTDWGMSHLCLWPRDTLGYLGLCSNTAFTEDLIVRDGFTPEQLAAQVAELDAVNTVKKCEASKIADAKH